VAKAGVDETERKGALANRSMQGVDDVIAMLLAFSAKPEELDILMVSLTFGNVEVQKYVSLFLSCVRRRRSSKKKNKMEHTTTTRALECLWRAIVLEAENRGRPADRSLLTLHTVVSETSSRSFTTLRRSASGARRMADRPASKRWMRANQLVKSTRGSLRCA
jgi:hypothetical protein